MKRSIVKNATLLGLFALLCTALVALVNQFTFERIKQQEDLELMRTLHQIIPDDMHDNALIEHCILIQDAAALGVEEPLPAYIASNQGEPVAIAIETVAPDGYNGQIKLIVAIDAKGEVLGVRTLNHNETPGLGDKIELRKSPWVFGFNGQSLQDDQDKRWAVKKDGGQFDQFTGATITPRAYVGAVRRTLLYFNTNKQTLLSRPANCEVNYE
ncbi:electron transport complex subunit RsxG [Shewanella marisflavi]|uniref:Ion-translocating oxidoreductase complex subunit G n=1 Tax=Shewanella marisflavi TaxID=260364 RepID=A0AAC9TZ23_9GAMM|nr:electron transport complex subunit RsxG [Shewanella marisflavi]ASJ96701.1 electron transport complex subunit RsxG [Shewanella marisflavi]MCL1041228.1 electron transport complex subunit RsxG [Shewanella marisflavi]